MKYVKRIVPCIIILCITFAVAACGEESSKVKREDVLIWSASNTEKILQDKEYTVKGGMCIDVKMFQNELEGAQLIITPSVKVDKYEIEVSDLVNSGDSQAKITQENIKIFNQKYISVERGSSNYLPLGMYPDALLPFETAKEYGENKVEANNNQGIYFQFSTDEQTKCGLYTGKFQVKISGNVYDIPVTVEVYDYTLSDKVNTRTSFGIHRYWGDGGIVSAENDASWEMYAAYYEYLLENRISARYLPAAMGDIDGFIVQLKKYSKDPKFSNYIIPYVEKYDATDVLGLKTGIDYELYEDYLWAIAEASKQEGRNLFEKASTYFAMFDEAKTTAQIATANHILTKVYALQEKVVEDMRAEFECDEPLKNDMIDKLLNINQLFVTSYQTTFTAGATYCPDVRQYSQAETRKQYDIEYKYNEGTENEYTQNAQKWWYTFLVPTTPMPTYHIDDYLYSSRIMSWMQYNYNIVGNLYWSSTFFLQTNKGVNTPIQDYYDTALRFIGNQNDGSNGDGFLMYPGNPYGIYGPVGSLRIEGIRDGMEEYDLLYQLEAEYNQVAKENNLDLNFDNVMELLYKRLYNGTVVNTTSEIFEKVRQELAQILVLSSKTGISLLDAKLNEKSMEVKVFVPSGKNIETNGQATTSGNVQTIKIDLNENSNYFSLKCGDYSLQIDLGGKMSMLTGQELKGVISLSDGSNSAVVSGEDIGYHADILRINLAKTEKIQTFSVTCQEVFALGANSESVQLEVYNDSNQEVIFQMYILNSDSLLTPISYVYLQPGWNTVTFNVSSVKWQAIGNVEKLKFDIGERGDNVSRILYIESLRFLSKST